MYNQEIIDHKIVSISYPYVLKIVTLQSCPIGILGQVWCLIVSIPDLCPLSSFYEVLEEGVSDFLFQ